MVKFLNSIKLGFRDFGMTINQLVVTITLIAVYIIGIGISAVLARLLKIHLLDLSVSPNKESYWTKLNLSVKPLQSYLRQY